jgi:hypothetical protein
MSNIDVDEIKSNIIIPDLISAFLENNSKLFLRKSLEAVRKSMKLNGFEVDLNPAANRRKTKLQTKKLSIQVRANSLISNKEKLRGSLFENRRSRKFKTSKSVKKIL